MSTELAHVNGNSLSSAVEAALAEGNLAKLTTEQRVDYYNATCKSLDINPLTRPFEYITLNGKLTLYATRACTEQLRSNRKVSLSIVARERHGEVYVVTARATTPDGRTDESTGAVVVGNLKGDALANALMKAETKAKRRVTLSICGLGFLDESETETIANLIQPPAPSPAPLNLNNGGTHPAVTEPVHIDAEVYGEHWDHRVESERSHYEGCELRAIPDAFFQLIARKPEKLLNFTLSDQRAIELCLQDLKERAAA